MPTPLHINQTKPNDKSRQKISQPPHVSISNATVVMEKSEGKWEKNKSDIYAFQPCLVCFLFNMHCINEEDNRYLISSPKKALNQGTWGLEIIRTI